MAITVQAQQADGAWSVRNAFVTENKRVLAGSMTKDELLAQARKVAQHWQSTYPGKALRVHDDSIPVAAAKEPATSAEAKRVLEALCEAAEGPSYNGEWRDVYLDNAFAKLSGMSIKSFRSYLAALSQSGFYKVIDGYAWGSVKDEAFQVIPNEAA